MNSMRRSTFVSLATSAIGMTLPRVSALAQSQTTLRVQGNPNDDATALFFALKSSGLFQKAGIDLHIESGTSGAAVAAAVAGGAIDVGKSSIISILEAHEKGIPFTLLAPAGLQTVASPFAGTIVLKDSPIRTGKDLENKTVGLSSLSSLGRAAVCRWVERAGGNWRSIQFVEIPLTQAAAAVSQKRVVASETAQPMLAAALGTGNFRDLPTYQTIAPRFVFTAWFTTKEWSSSHPEVARSFARIIAQSAAYANTHHAETAPVMAQLGNVDLSVVQNMQRVVGGTVLDPSLIQPVIEASTAYGMLKAGFPARQLIDANALTR